MLDPALSASPATPREREWYQASLSDLLIVLLAAGLAAHWWTNVYLHPAPKLDIQGGRVRLHLLSDGSLKSGELQGGEEALEELAAACRQLALDGQKIHLDLTADRAASYSQVVRIITKLGAEVESIRLGAVP